jgi:hypothetical protein
MKRTVEVFSSGKTLSDAFDQALAGFFFKPEPSPETLEDAKAHGEKIHKFKLTLELVED